MSGSRRFLNAVLRNRFDGFNSLHRIDLSRSLFYPSAQAAEEAAPAKPTTFTLPPPTLAFSHRDMAFFALLRGGSRIIGVHEEGHAAIYDMDARSIAILPTLDGEKEEEEHGVSFSMYSTHDVTLSIAHDGNEEETLYVMDTDMGGHIHFYALSSRHNGRRWNWEHLPPPPFLDDKHWQSRHDSTIISYAAVDGGKTIYVSTSGVGTFRFDTASRAWSKAGDWMLPFHGRAEHVPELDNLWFGTAASHPYDVCAADLSDVDCLWPPAVQHVWQDIHPPNPKDGYERDPPQLFSMGSGRFCSVKTLMIEIDDGYGGTFHLHDLHVLTGVEVLRCGDEDDADRQQPGRGLRIVKHKSKRFKVKQDFNGLTEFL